MIKESKDVDYTIATMEQLERLAREEGSDIERKLKTADLVYDGNIFLAIVEGIGYSIPKLASQINIDAH
jgi:hypothetical protein